MTHPLAALIVGVPRHYDSNADRVMLEADVLAALEAATPPDLTDSVTVHANMLRGTIAKPTVDQIIHLYGREAFQPMIDAAVAKALKDACLAVSEHADWPEDEHGRTEQAGLFARAINAICAIAPAAPHVNETPKSEHDAGNVLTVPDLVEAGKVLEGVTPGPWKADYSKWKPSNFIVQTDHPCRRVLAKFDGDGDGPDAQSLADARFIAWCREGVPALIALATAQAAQIAGLTKERDRIGLEEKMRMAAWCSKRQAITAKAWQRAARKALDGDMSELRNRIAMIDAGPLNVVQSDETRAEAAEAEAATLRAEVERLRGAAKALEKAASEVSRRGAETGPQWTKLTIALLSARAALSEAEDRDDHP